MTRPRPSVELSDEALRAALRDVDGRARLVVAVKPKSKREGLEIGPDGGVLVRVAAPPVDGKANLRIIEVLADVLDLPKGAVKLVRGESARHKELSLDLDVEEVRARLLGATSGP